MIRRLWLLLKSIRGGFRCYDLTGTDSVFITLALRRRTHGRRFGY